MLEPLSKLEELVPKLLGLGWEKLTLLVKLRQLLHVTGRILYYNQFDEVKRVFDAEDEKSKNHEKALVLERDITVYLDLAGPIVDDGRAYINAFLDCMYDSNIHPLFLCDPSGPAPPTED